MDFETRRKYQDAFKAYREVRQAVNHLNSDDFHTLPEDDRRNTLRDYSSKFHIWKSQIPEQLHPRMPCLNMLQLYVAVNVSE